jgi:hypothetical protein
MCLLAVATGNPPCSGGSLGRIASARLFVARHMGEAIQCVVGEGGALLPSADYTGGGYDR